MADGISAKVIGLPDFTARLKALGIDMETKIVRSGVLAAGAVFRKAAQANAPSLSKPDTHKKNPRVAGMLKKSIFSVRSRSMSSPGTEVAVVSVSGGTGVKKGKDAFYWRWVEAGHLARGPGQRLKGGKNSRSLQRKRLTAGGGNFVPGVFFLKRAFDNNVGAAIAAFNAKIEARILKANQDINKK